MDMALDLITQSAESGCAEAMAMLG